MSDMPPKEFFPAKSRLVIGVVVMVVTLGLSFGRWYSAKGPLETLAWFEQHRGPGDSLAYASAIYHATHARAVHDNRWRPTGYATLGLVGTAIGLALIVSARRRHTA